MYKDYPWLNKAALTFLRRDYLQPKMLFTDRVYIMASRAEKLSGIPGLAKRFTENLKKGWYSLASPIWTNFGSDRGLPISCFGSYVSDTMESILGTHAEIGMMSKFGGGTSVYFGEVRERGAPIKGGRNGSSAGAVHFMQLFDQAINIVSQGSSRRGQCAAYLPISHPDIMEFLSIRTEGSPIQSLSTGVCVPDSFMETMIAGDEDARNVWARVLESRSETGYPYIFFTDNANRGTVDCYHDRQINHSNLCTEIMLPNDPDESFVCDLSSMNVLHYDEWRDTDAVDVLTFFLDAVMSEFIEKTENVWGMQRARRFAERHRALGIGQLGWHSYLQSKMIPFESAEARRLSGEVALEIKEQAYRASAELARRFGETEVTRGYGRRNTTLTAIAPTKSSSFILGQVSEGVEPIRSNYYIRDVQKGKFTIRNPHLREVLEQHGEDHEETWRSILTHAGSVQHLDFLSDNERAVFRTMAEISPAEIVAQTAMRLPHVDQGQSTNLMIHPSIPIRDVNQLVIQAWQYGVKSLYYQISVNAAQEFARDILGCSVCEA